MISLHSQEEEADDGPNHEVEAKSIRGVGCFTTEAINAENDKAGGVGDPEGTEKSED